ncbi:sigma-54-dependent transcriptional regulator [Chitinophaga arvensicola]|uniref:DNA-binding transcriptional response regulator, NtrC family, contains REC, AAA-type ATPase, and a Fis-type DNA-binding domains n=1 Tax=Chitinophaga arvensicola TaxID=29529 RepID=A0A1I0R4L4_9BACT|nr:sigma-54 dependent transcriptional regulator [Chitinophaga arvensicola]SEW35361.1 DNA-binding transcriptional response regulator, NtrC family, contains REC, AAA-type ATPase, and a Fis-type DNA-binding domains [Chitinophaga arvensicola]
MTNGTILLVEDEEKLRQLLKRIITLEGFRILECDTLKAARQLLHTESIDVVLSDIMLPDGNGIDLVTYLREKQLPGEIILLTAYGNIADSVRAIKNGAFDYLTKGNDNARIIPLLHRALEKVQLQNRVAHLQTKISNNYASFDALLGTSAVIREAKELAMKAAPSDAAVLLLGETGSGKEMFAQAIHHASHRAGKDFLAINCSAIGKDILESEIFGYKAGAFTGAVKNKKGLIEEAHQGTLFLDEIGEMPLDLQAKLLRVLETSEFIKVGDTRVTKVDIRIIAATNRKLEQEIEQGRFREDLYYRLNVFTIELPALRERSEDIPLFAEHYLQLFANKTNKPVFSMSREFIEHLKLHEWRGNIRELKNIMERAVIICTGNTLTMEALPLEFKLHKSPVKQKAGTFDLAVIEKLHIQWVMDYVNGNKSKAARLLNIGLSTLYRKMEEYKMVL